MENLLPSHGEAFLIPLFLETQEADKCYREFLEKISWRQETIRLYGRDLLQPRLTAFAGDAGKTYTYSGREMVPEPWSDILLALKQQVETVAASPFNAVLLNYYRDGQDSMGWHRDNEKSLGPQPVIASVSLGDTRLFKWRRYGSHENTTTLPLTHGSLLLMKGNMQQYWEHSLPKTTKPVEPRINLTFRKLL